MANKIEVCILIPNYDGQEYLFDCLNALVGQTYKDFKIILIDDASNDGSVSYVNNHFPQVDILKLGNNVGFAQAVNLGIKHAFDRYQPKYLAFLNNDTSADPVWLQALVAAVESGQKIAAVSSNMVFFDQPGIINSQGGTCDLIGYAKDINCGKRVKDGYDSQRLILSACWGAALVKTSTLEDVGLLDERYFSFAEDVDWGWRANLLGYQIIFEPKALVLHHGSASWRGQDLRRHKLCFRNMFCTLLKNYSTPRLFMMLVVVLLHYPLVSLGYALNIKLKAGRLVRVFEGKNSLTARLWSSLIPWQSLAWNLKELKTTMNFRKSVQARRRVADREIIKLMDL